MGKKRARDDAGVCNACKKAAAGVKPSAIKHTHCREPGDACFREASATRTSSTGAGEAAGASSSSNGASSSSTIPHSTDDTQRDVCNVVEKLIRDVQQQASLELLRVSQEGRSLATIFQSGRAASPSTPADQPLAPPPAPVQPPPAPPAEAADADAAAHPQQQQQQEQQQEEEQQQEQRQQQEEEEQQQEQQQQQQQQEQQQEQLLLLQQSAPSPAQRGSPARRLTRPPQPRRDMTDFLMGSAREKAGREREARETKRAAFAQPPSSAASSSAAASSSTTAATAAARAATDDAAPADAAPATALMAADADALVAADADAAPAAAAVPLVGTWCCTECDKQAPLPRSALDVQASEVLLDGLSFADISPTYAQLELNALHSAEAVRALAHHRKQMHKVPDNFVIKRLAAARKKNENAAVPDGVLRFAMACALVAAEERELRVRIGCVQLRGELQRFVYPARPCPPGERPREGDFLLGQAEPIVIINADFRDIGVPFVRCWGGKGCLGIAHAEKYYGRTKFTNVSSPVGITQLADFMRTYVIAPRIQCSACGTSRPMNHKLVLEAVPPAAVERYYPVGLVGGRSQTSRVLADVLESMQVSSPASVAALTAAIAEANAKGYERAALQYEIACGQHLCVHPPALEAELQQQPVAAAEGEGESELEESDDDADAEEDDEEDGDESS